MKREGRQFYLLALSLGLPLELVSASVESLILSFGAAENS